MAMTAVADMGRSIAAALGVSDGVAAHLSPIAYIAALVSHPSSQCRTGTQPQAHKLMVSHAADNATVTGFLITTAYGGATGLHACIVQQQLLPPWDTIQMFLFDVMLNTIGSILVMAVIAIGIQAVEDFLDGNPDRFPRFPSLRTAIVLRYNPITCNIHVAVLFGLAMAALGINVSNPFPSTLTAFMCRFALALVVYDIGLYFAHVAQHIVPFTIKYHRVHHQVPLYAWDVINADVIDFVEDFIPILIIPTVFGFNIVEVWALTVFLQLHGAVVHSGCSIPVMDSFDFVMVGPRFHALHHVIHKSNYGAFLSVWDHLFGTSVAVDVTEARLWRPRFKANVQEF